MHHEDLRREVVLGHEIREKLGQSNGADCWNVAQGIDFQPFGDVEQSVIDDVEAIKASPLLRKGVPVRGFVYEVETGRIRPVI